MRPEYVATALRHMSARQRLLYLAGVAVHLLTLKPAARAVLTFALQALERDLDGSETAVIPDLMRRLLYTLTLDKTIE